MCPIRFKDQLRECVADADQLLQSADGDNADDEVIADMSCNR